MVRDAVVEEIRERADLVEVAGEHTSLKRVGKSWRGPCPLHGGDGPNFSVDRAKGIFKCFVCGEGGDVYAYVMKRLGLDFPEAVRHLGRRVGVEVPDREERREDPWRHLREAAAFAAEWFAERLRSPDGEEARSYLEGRGIDGEAAERYALGYAPGGWRALREAAAERGLPEEHLLEIGLLARSERAPEPYDRFRNRLVFTIVDPRERPIGFGGRRLERADAPKYMNSPDSPIFHKREVLYGLAWARHGIRREGYAAVVEGYTDVLSLHTHGLPLAVAGLGTSFTEEQGALLARYAEKAYLLYDSDEAGLRATFRTADVLLGAGVHPLVVSLPEGEDPDSLVRRQGVEALRVLFGEAVDVLERKLQILERQGYLASIEGRRRAVDGLLSTLRATRDPALRDIYLDRAAARTGVRRETLVREVAAEGARGARRRPRRGDAGGEAGAGAARPGSAGSAAIERHLLLLLVRDRGADPGAEAADEALMGREEPLVLRVAAAGVEPEHFRDPGHRAIYAWLRAEAEHEADVRAPGPDGTARGGREGAHGSREGGPELDPSHRELLESLRADPVELTSPVEILDEAVRRLLHRPALDRLREIDREMRDADEEHQRRLLVEFEGIARELREAGFPLSFLRRRSGTNSGRGQGGTG